MRHRAWDARDCRCRTEIARTVNAIYTSDSNIGLEAPRSNYDEAS